jgi:hypothetical protein
VRSILDAHYLHRDPAIAWNAIRKLEMGFAGSCENNGAALRCSGAGTVAEHNVSPGAESLQTALQTGPVVVLPKRGKGK